MKCSTALKSFILSSLFASLDGMVTLRLSNDVVYGQSFALVCYTTNQIAVYATFYRYKRASDIGINDLSAMLGTVSGSTCQPDTLNLTKYTYSCSSDGKEISLIVPAENIMEHDTVWKCSNAEASVVTNNNNVTIFVNVPVSSLQLSPYGRVNINEFETNVFTCATSFCRPQATVSWWKNNANITNTADTPTYVQNYTAGSLKYNGSRLDNGHTIVCKASNGYGDEKTSQQSAVLNIRYVPASSPSIDGYYNGSIFSIIQNTPKTFSCSITGGNPLASLSWNCFGFLGSFNIVEQTVISNITLNVNKSRGSQPCACLSSHEVQGNRTAIILVEILYPPIVIPFATPVKGIEGDPLEVVCISDGNPIPNVTWSPTGEDTSNKSRLYYHSITKSNGGTHKCTASSTMRPTNGNPVNMSDTMDVFIEVLYPPTVVPFTVPKHVIEGNSLEVICRSDGNPTPDLAWSPQGEDTVNKSRLYYHAITKHNNGTHRCTASSTMIPTSGNPVNVSDANDVLIDVLYRASISAFTAYNNNMMIMENDSLQLLCQVDSNPYSDIFLYYEDNLQLNKEENSLKMNYTKKKAECLDAGKYTCHANNSIMDGYSASSDLQIMVACSPRLDHRKNVSTVYYTGLNTNVTLEVYVIAYPEPTNITWYHRDNETDTWQRVTYQPLYSGGHFSSILIHLTSIKDFGYYMVTMDNYLGNISSRYKIIPESIPEVPKNLNVTEHGPDYLTLKWAPGFEGGHPQHFIIEYTRHSDGGWIKSDEIWDDGSPMQSFILSALQQKTTYQLLMYAENKIGRSEKTQVINATTSDKVPPIVFPIGAVAGGISGAVAAVVLVILVLIFLRRGGLRSEDKGDDFTRKLRAKESPESGLVNNPVYDSSGPLPGPSASSAAVGTEYAVVIKKTRVEDASNLYAQVDKKNNKKKGGQKGKGGLISSGDIYENSNLVGQSTHKDKAYENSKDIKTYEASDDNVCENPGAASSIGSWVSHDGVHYADLMLDPPTTKNGKPFIRGLEDRTEYAEIAYGKRGEPLPDSDNEHEKKNKGGATAKTDN